MSVIVGQACSYLTNYTREHVDHTNKRKHGKNGPAHSIVCLPKNFVYLEFNDVL